MSGLRPSELRYLSDSFEGLIQSVRFISQSFPKNFDFCTTPEKVDESFRSIAAERAVWVLFDANYC